MNRLRLRLLTWMAFLAALLMVLTQLDSGALAGPSLNEPSSWWTWLSHGDSTAHVMALLRLAVFGWCGYLAAVALAQLVGSFRGMGLVRGAADRMTSATARRILKGTIVVALAAPAPAGASTAARPPVMVLVTPTTTIATTTSTTSTTTSTAAPPANAAPAAHAHGPQPSPTQPSPQTPTPIAPSPGQPWKVEAGDHLWSISERALSAHRGRDVSDIEIAPYWRDVIEANTSLLVDPDNPDLLYPGQVLTLPPLG